jgi:hypothetical protein
MKPVVLQIGFLLLALAMPGLSEQNAGRPKAPPMKPGPMMRRVPPPKLPKGLETKGPRFNNPASAAARLYLATPEQRERALELLRPQQQEAARRNLAWFDGLPKEDQAVVIRRTERFAALAPQKKRAFVLQMQALNRMPPARKRMITAALIRLQTMPDEQRAEALASEEYRSRFSPDEHKIIEDLSEVMPAPIQQ